MKVVEWSEIGSEIAKELQKQRENTLKICVQATEILLAAGVDLLGIDGFNAVVELDDWFCKTLKEDFAITIDRGDDDE
jgi:hypothetical protein